MVDSPVAKPATTHCVVSLGQMDTTVQIGIEFGTLEEADAFFEKIASDHLDTGVITIRTGPEAKDAG